MVILASLAFLSPMKIFSAGPLNAGHEKNGHQAEIGNNGNDQRISNKDTLSMVVLI